MITNIWKQLSAAFFILYILKIEIPIEVLCTYTGKRANRICFFKFSSFWRTALARQIFFVITLIQRCENSGVFSIKSWKSDRRNLGLRCTFIRIGIFIFKYNTKIIQNKTYYCICVIFKWSEWSNINIYLATPFFRWTYFIN